MRVFNISVPDKPLTNIELVRYARLLKIPDFRGVFMRDTLPQYPLNVECGIVYFNTSNQPGSHWVCYYRKRNLLLLDDCFLGKQNNTEAYYTRGRHNNCDTIYIAQNYFRLPRHTIRENSNFIILFPQDTKNLTHIDCAGDIPLLEFKQFCHRVRSEDHNFVTIDLTSTPTNGKYRQNLNRFYFPTGTV